MSLSCIFDCIAANFYSMRLVFDYLLFLSRVRGLDTLGSPVGGGVDNLAPSSAILLLKRSRSIWRGFVMDEECLYSLAILSSSSCKRCMMLVFGSGKEG